jgi:SAM-dependent methyltransferase
LSSPQTFAPGNDGSRRTANVMEGGGAYNEHSRPQSVYARYGTSFLEQAARRASVPADGSPAILLDLGASQGANSVLPMGAAIDALRERHGSDLPVIVVHADLPQNDFGTLFELLADDRRSYRRGRPGVFGLAAGNTYHRPLVPDGSVSLAWASTTVHWLDEVPASVPDGIWPQAAGGQARELWRAQAAREWATFVAVVGDQLRPGGRLVVVTSSVDAQGRTGGEPVMDLIWRAAQERLPAEELDELVIPLWFRSDDEFNAPFAQSPTMRLEFYERGAIVEPIRLDYENHGNAERFARELARYLQATFGPPLVSGLPLERRGPASDAIFARVAELVESDPLASFTSWDVLTIVARKEAP